MPHEIVSLKNVHKAVGYSHVARVGNLCLISGQIAMNKEGKVVGKGDIDAQVRQALDNLKAVLEELGGGMQHVAKTTVLLTHAGFIPAYRAVRVDYFSDPMPASTLMIVESLASPDFLVEVEAIAVID
jgi:enamine deaminase RidA (YjgF/YER057c/UK114 family)